MTPWEGRWSDYAEQGGIMVPMSGEVAWLTPEGRRARREILHIRHHSLYVPRDFDVSPFFEIVKPRLAQGFDHRALEWKA